MQATVAKEEAAGSCTFYLVPVARLHASQAKGELTLPSFNELRQDLVTRTPTRSECYRAKHTGKILAVSHRWEHPDAPDTKGVQLEAILKHLSQAGSSVEYVWFECAPHASIGPPPPPPRAQGGCLALTRGMCACWCAAASGACHRESGRGRTSWRSAGCSRTSTSCTSAAPCCCWWTSRTSLAFVRRRRPAPVSAPPQSAGRA